MAKRIRFIGAAVLFCSFFLAGPASAQDAPRKKVLFLTKSQGFEHSVIARKGGQLGWAEKLMIDFAGKAGFDVTCTKDASDFTDENIAKYDVFAFYVTGDLTRDSVHNGVPEKGMTPAQKDAMMKAIESGKGVFGVHSATDAFHAGNRVDPYVTMMGGEFLTHGSQQKATMKVAFKFPGLEDLQDFTLLDEWYCNKNVNPDMTVILVQDTESMKNDRGQRERPYQRPPYPATWARMQGKGRVFYTSMGHREDVWTNPTFQKVVIAGLNWVSGRTNVELKQNITEVTPGYNKTTLD